MIVIQTPISKKPHCFLSTKLGTHSFEQDIVPGNFKEIHFEILSGAFEPQHINT